MKDCTTLENGTQISNTSRSRKDPVILVRRDPCAAVRSASRALTRFYDLVLAPAGVRATQFITLQAIAERGEIAQWELAQDYGLAVETLSRRLGVLRRVGLIAMRSGTGHHGERLYSLTRAGFELLKNAAPYWQRAQNRLRAVLADDQKWREALSLAHQLTDAAKAAEDLKIANVGNSPAGSAVAAD